ncbi:hypothetical protein FRC00_001714 [Tulasnella sp. 408]|nr:hypothetical protein FRC00_001714 [Tulasnella sp. 408]
MSDSGTVMTTTEAQAPPRRQPTVDPRIRPGVGPQQGPSPHLRIPRIIQSNTPPPLAQQNHLQAPNRDLRAHPEILNHSQAGERNVPPCPPCAHPLAVGVGVAAQPPPDEVVRTLNDELGAERVRGRKLERQLALLSDERDSLIAERDAARAERDTVITVNIGLEAQILAVEKLLKGLESYARAGLWETTTLWHTP